MSEKRKRRRLVREEQFVALAVIETLQERIMQSGKKSFTPMEVWDLLEAVKADPALIDPEVRKDFEAFMWGMETDVASEKTKN